MPCASDKFTVGLTGGIACGKSVISGFFAELGIDIVDADIVARELVAPGAPLLDELVTCFGKGIICSNGCLDRPALRRLVFADSQQLQALNSIMHPAINRRLLQLIAQAGADYVILVLPLLFENHLEHMIDRILVANAAPHTQILRTMERDKCTAEQARNIIAVQVSEEYRCAHADDLIHTDRCTLPEIRQRVTILDRRYRNLACPPEL